MERRHRLVVMLLAVVLTAVPAGAAVRTWDGGGGDSFWDTTANWNPDGYSDSDDLIVLSGGPTSLGYVEADNGGTITLDGPAVVAHFSSVLVIAGGADASGRLDVLNGADVSNTYCYLGYNSGSSGTATVSGAGSTWTNSSYLFVGDYGTGVLSITSGGAVSNTDGYLGRKSAGSGEVTVSGAGSTWTNSSHLNVGYSGTGTLSITSGGAVSNTNGVLGDDSGASGEVTVSGAGSTWTNSNLFVGNSGTGVLSITSGGTVSNTNAYLGYSSTASGEVTVSGAGSTWNNSGTIYVGDSGTGALSITSGGAVSNTDGYLGYYSGSSGEVTVSGAGSTWNNSNDLYVGRYGTGALSITSGGAVSNTYGYLGNSSTASGEVTVSGAGSTWNNSSDLYVGYSGTGALSITDGGAVSNTIGYLGYGSGASGTGTVSGAGSTWNNSSTLCVGKYSTGALSITGGGAVSNTYGYLGYNSTGSGTATVSGAGSTWNNSGYLYVGFQGTGVLTVRDGGAVSVAASLRIGQYSGSDGTVNLEDGSLTVRSITAGSGTATFNWTGGTLGITGTGGLTLSSTGLLGPTVNIHAGKGLDVAAATTVNSGVTLAVTGGTFSTDSLTVSGTAQLRSGVITIGETFTVNNAGELEIAGQDLVLTAAPTLNTGSELILDGTTMTAPSLTLPSGASIDLDSGKISAAGTFSNSGVVRMGNTGAATIRANVLNNNNTGVVMGRGTIQTEVSNDGNMGFSGDAFLTEDVANNVSALIAISGGAGATFYEDVTNNGELRVGTGCTATFYGSLSGSGCTGTGTVYLDGDMRPGASPGEMSFGGDVVFGMAASMEAELAGTGTGQYDSIDVTGGLSLAGTLNVVLIDGFDPGFGDTFDLLDWGSLDGEFNTVNLPGLSGGLTWDDSDLYNTGEISVTAFPGDADLDGDVDDVDLALLLNGWPMADPTWGDGDFDVDSDVDDTDLAQLLNNWGMGVPVEAVPEPASAALLLLGFSGLLWRRMKR